MQIAAAAAQQGRLSFQSIQPQLAVELVLRSHYCSALVPQSHSFMALDYSNPSFSAKVAEGIPKFAQPAKSDTIVLASSPLRSYAFLERAQSTVKQHILQTVLVYKYSPIHQALIIQESRCYGQL